MSGFFKKLRNPIIFQGNLKKKKNYYEGWYYKLVGKGGSPIYAFIAGIALNKDPSKTHAFIQMFDGLEETYTYFRYPAGAFKPASDKFEVYVDKNYFSADKIILDINHEKGTVKGELEFSELTPLPTSFLYPNIMGWTTYVPGILTKHGVVSVNHYIKGSITVNGKTYDFTGGKGYTEKDFGTSFPKSYVWMQTNHFSEDKRSMLFSAAAVPYLGKKRIGFLGFLWDRGTFYKFGNYFGHKITVFEKENGKRLNAEIMLKKYKLEIDAEKIGGIDMMSPEEGAMESTINESLRSVIGIKFSKKTKNGWETVIEDTGKPAGVEIEDSNDEIYRLIYPKK